MKKIIIAAAFAACALGMNAQLTVLKSGNVRIGYKSLVQQPWKPANATSATIPGNTDLLACPDSLSNGRAVRHHTALHRLFPLALF